MTSPFLISTNKLFLYYKSLAEKAIAQIDDTQINWQPNDTSNSIALIVHHITGNMLSRFTDFLTTDGEKPWRNREAEFEQGYANKAELMAAWDRGWKVLTDTIASLSDDDLAKIIYIRNEGQSVQDALLRQLAHYANHVGQIIYIAKILKGNEFRSLSIPKGGSAGYNQQKFAEDKSVRHFTDKV